MLHLFDDTFILETYYRSIELNLEEEFIFLLQNELLSRGFFEQNC
nr:sporulation histidine kinase inhibitor Sda [Halalkalibacter akibai]